MVLFTIVLLTSNTFAAEQIHVKVTISFNQTPLATPTLVVEENSITTMSMTMPSYQTYELSFMIIKEQEQLFADIEFTSGEHNLKEKLKIERDVKNLFEIDEYRISIKPKYLD